MNGLFTFDPRTKFVLVDGCGGGGGGGSGVNYSLFAPAEPAMGHLAFSSGGHGGGAGASCASVFQDVTGLNHVNYSIGAGGAGSLGPNLGSANGNATHWNFSITLQGGRGNNFLQTSNGTISPEEFFFQNRSRESVNGRHDRLLGEHADDTFIAAYEHMVVSGRLGKGGAVTRSSHVNTPSVLSTYRNTLFLDELNTCAGGRGGVGGNIYSSNMAGQSVGAKALDPDRFFAGESRAFNYRALSMSHGGGGGNSVKGVGGAGKKMTWDGVDTSLEYEAMGPENSNNHVYDRNFANGILGGGGGGGAVDIAYGSTAYSNHYVTKGGKGGDGFLWIREFA